MATKFSCSLFAFLKFVVVVGNVVDETFSFLLWFLCSQGYHIRILPRGGGSVAGIRYLQARDL